jgi:hypothetical protein
MVHVFVNIKAKVVPQKGCCLSQNLPSWPDECFNSFRIRINRTPGRNMNYSLL